MSRAAARLSLRRSDLPILLFFHGYALAHTIRPLVVARALRERGYPVVLAGRGPHAVRVRQEGFDVHDVETLPQCRMDQFVARGEYNYYDHEWIDRCVRSERMLIQMLRPALVIHEMKPTAHLSARLEGVDDARITQAYRHPAYAHRIPLTAGLEVDSDLFVEYLATIAFEVKAQQSFSLLADVPELHPVRRPAATYHFAGPLLDRPKEPESLDVLDDGWDTDLPLIYITCGSSGRAPRYLDGLVEALRGKPYRVLITTANRWSADSSSGASRHELPANVRVVPFLSGEWILRRAEMLVGVVGIGAIYQALCQGRPIIGAPEHLDQEYHLNRVRDLGLGLKIDRADFDAEHITKAIEHVLVHRTEYQARCAPFSECLSEWSGGGRAADLVDAHLTQRDQRYATSTAYLVPGDEFVRYLDASTPATLDATGIRKMLLRGVRRGMPHRWIGKSLYFDRCDSWNWLYENDTEFFAADYRACDRRRRHFLEMRSGDIRPRSAWQRFHLTYRLRLHPRAADGSPVLSAGERLKIFLPYPIQRPGQQSEAMLTAMLPEAFASHLTPDLGMVYGPEVTVQDGDEPLEFGYACNVSVRALDPECESLQESPSEAERARCLQLDPRIRRVPELIRLRQELALDELSNDEEKARAIYAALATTRRFRKTRDGVQTPHYSTTAVLRTDGGHCTTLARAFACLCRAEGIPTREVTGALLGYPVADDVFELRSYGEPLFGHTWIEAYLEGRGWVPVEFHGIVIGAQSLTSKNVSDRRLRREIVSQTEPFLHYYFGHLDNHRVLSSPSVKRTPLVMSGVDDPAPGERPWVPRYDLRYDCLLRAECV